MSLAPGTVGAIQPFEVSVSGLLIDVLASEACLTAKIKQNTSAGIRGCLSVSIRSRTTTVNRAAMLSSSVKNKLGAFLCL